MESALHEIYITYDYLPNVKYAVKNLYVLKLLWRLYDRNQLAWFFRP